MHALRVRYPLPQRITGRITAQRQHIANPGLGIVGDHLLQFGHRVVHRGEMRHRDDGGLLRDPPGDPQGAVAVGPPGAIGHRCKGGLQRLEVEHRLPELALPGVVAGRENSTENTGRSPPSRSMTAVMHPTLASRNARRGHPKAG